VESGSSGTLAEKSPQPLNGVKPVSPEQEELIHRLVYFQNEFEHPSEEDVKRITVRINLRHLPRAYPFIAERFPTKVL